MTISWWCDNTTNLFQVQCTHTIQHQNAPCHIHEYVPNTRTWYSPTSQSMYFIDGKSMQLTFCVFQAKKKNQQTHCEHTRLYIYSTFEKSNFEIVCIQIHPKISFISFCIVVSAMILNLRHTYAFKIDVWMIWLHCIIAQSQIAKLLCVWFQSQNVQKIPKRNN